MNYNYKMYRLVVKGNKSQCLAAIAQRGLTAIGVQEIDRYRDCAIDVESCHEYLGKWFNEPAECEQFVGFPVGTLLNFTSHQDYTKPLNELV